MKDNLEYKVERERNAQLEAVAMLIKRRIMGYLQRKKFVKIRDHIIKIQKNYKVLECSVLLLSLIVQLLCSTNTDVVDDCDMCEFFLLGSLLSEAIHQNEVGSHCHSEGKIIYTNNYVNYIKKEEACLIRIHFSKKRI